MSKNLSLPALRKVCGFTQAELAKKIGVSTPTIVAVENGKRALTDENARKIMRVTGVRWQSLVKDVSPVALEGQPYTPEHWDRWRKSMRRPGRASTHAEDTLREILAARFAMLLKSAFACGRLYLLAEEFGLMCNRLFEEPGIERCYKEQAGGEGLPRDLPQIVENYLHDSTRELENRLNEHERILLHILRTHGAPQPVFKAVESQSDS